MALTPEEQVENAVIVEAIRRVGIAIPHLWVLVSTRDPYPEAIPVLLSLLPQMKVPSVKEGIVRALSVKETPQAAVSLLIDEYRKSLGHQSYEQFRWVIGNALSLLARKEHSLDLIDLLKRPEGGLGRQMVASTLGRLKDPRAVPILIELLDDPEVALHAAGALGNMRAIEAREALARVAEGHPHPSIRKKAKESIEKLDRPLRISRPKKTVKE